MGAVRGKAFMYSYSWFTLLYNSNEHTLESNHPPAENLKKKKTHCWNCPPTSKNLSHCGRELVSSQRLTSPILLVFAKWQRLVWCLGASLVAQMVKRLPAMWETWVRSLGREDSLEGKWQPSSVFLPRKSLGQRSLAGYSWQGLRESDTTEQLHFSV